MNRDQQLDIQADALVVCEGQGCELCGNLDPEEQYSDNAQILAEDLHESALGTAWDGHIADESELSDYRRESLDQRTSYQQRDPWQESHGDEDYR